MAIVIPTLNEQYYIGNLLDSIASQSVLPKEIVVVDAQSKDQTIREVKKRQKKLYQLKVYQMPRYSISRQRNFGASKTSARHLLFLDADMELKEPFTLEVYMEEVKRKNPDLAAARNFPDSTKLMDRAYFSGLYLGMKGLKYVWPVVTAQNLYVKREIFELFGGFDEEVFVGEDCEMVQRMIKGGVKFIFLKKPRLYTSVRRLEKEGRTKYLLKLIKAYWEVKKYGYKDLQIDYKFGHFSNNS